MTNRFEEFANKRGLTITGFSLKSGPAGVSELDVEYTKYLEGFGTVGKHADMPDTSGMEDLILLSSCVSVRSYDRVSEPLPVVTALVYTAHYVQSRAVKLIAENPWSDRK